MLYLTKEQKKKVVEHCRREAPDEACGILAGREGRVESVYPMANADRSPETFLMDPKEQLKVIKEMRSSGLEMTAIYHSHTHTAAYPSHHDVALAFYPEASYLIVSLKDEDSPDLRSFKIAGGEITEEGVKII